jgi:predicted Zn-dependent protease with MMP-like domain
MVCWNYTPGPAEDTIEDGVKPDSVTEQMTPLMTMSEFKAIVKGVMASLPPEFTPFLDNLVVDVAEEPDLEMLRDAGFTDEEIDEGDSLLGLFESIDYPAGAYDAVDFPDLPHRLWVFKNPHEDEFPEPDRLRIEIRKTVIHELGHHFGFDERDLERFDANPDPFGGK